MGDHDGVTVDGMLKRMREILFPDEEAEDCDEDDMCRALCEAAACLDKLEAAIKAEREHVRGVLCGIRFSAEREESLVGGPRPLERLRTVETIAMMIGTDLEG